MAYIYDGKFHRTDKLTCDDHRDIALLVNAGVRHRVLAEDYGVSQESIHMIAYKRKRWIPVSQVAKTRDAKLYFAQKLYRDSQTAPKMCAYVVQEAFQPLVPPIVARVTAVTPKQRLLAGILGRSAAYSTERNALIGARALEIVKDHALRGHKLYAGIDDAVERASARLLAQERRGISERNKREQELLNGTMDALVTALPATEQEIVRRNYGIGCLAESTGKIAKDFDRTRQWVWNHLQIALELMRPKVCRALTRT
jgi:hypothetical protein